MLQKLRKKEKHGVIKADRWVISLTRHKKLLIYIPFIKTFEVLPTIIIWIWNTFNASLRNKNRYAEKPRLTSWFPSDATLSFKVWQQKLPVFNSVSFTKATAHKSHNISKDKHIKKVLKTPHSSNWILCPRPARSRFSLHGALKTLQKLQMSCELFFLDLRCY